MLDALGVKSVLNLSYSGFRDTDAIQAFEDALLVDADEYPGRFRFAATFNVTQFNEPGYADRVIAKLERDIEVHGAVAVKIWKDLGMLLTDDQGHYVFCDDVPFTPIFDYIAAKGLVVYSHIADPLAGWQSLDVPTPHTRYYRAHPEFHWYGQPDKPSHAEILRHRDALVARYPKTPFVGAHLASLEYDLEVLAEFLDSFPNAHIDTAARVPDLMLKPDDQVRGFFAKYQDRILYGTDWEYDGNSLGDSPAEKTARRNACIESRCCAFVYFEDTLALPEEILHKFYFDNANALFGCPARPGDGA
ncbi:MAG TPA: amidohydrolase family protein [Candidatus Hydrogenedentes bacterium]|nr:amidohydrolase family protein [Candidatus Hydrogenedentota bacterium]